MRPWYEGHVGGFSEAPEEAVLDLQSGGMFPLGITYKEKETREDPSWSDDRFGEYSWS